MDNNLPVKGIAIIRTSDSTAFVVEATAPHHMQVLQDGWIHLTADLPLEIACSEVARLAHERSLPSFWAG